MVGENRFDSDSSRAARDALSRFLASAECSLDAATQDRLVDLALLLAQWGSGMNLSGYREPESVMEGLICDGLALWFAFREHPVFVSPAEVSDLGACTRPLLAKRGPGAKVFTRVVLLKAGISTVLESSTTTKIHPHF